MAYSPLVLHEPEIRRGMDPRLPIKGTCIFSFQKMLDKNTSLRYIFVYKFIVSGRPPKAIKMVSNFMLRRYGKGFFLFL
jgi:hypothetical protein